MSSDSIPYCLTFPPDLPITARKDEIVAAIQAHPVVILAGETGSGKTTQIPKLCLAAGRGTKGRIACTQPRRVAALSVSRRVAEELRVDWGNFVGCKVRFEDRTSRNTTVKFLTDGMLLAELHGDPMLSEYDTVIIDEAHERSLNIDFLLGYLRQLRHRRPELRIVVTSATIDTQAFSKAFDDAPIIEVSGRTFPVEVIYAPLDQLGSDAWEDDEPAARSEALHYIDGAVEAVHRILRESDRGDILIFMPAERDIREATDLLDGKRLRSCDVIPLFGRLSNSEQQRVFAPCNGRKIILATNIAETSLTIPGIRFVIDTGLARVSRYTPQSRTRRLPIEEISQASAEQRKGRAGRVAEGVCIRLYSEKNFNERPRFAQPEIQRSNLADVILRMKAFGLGDVERFPFINMPSAKAIHAGYGLLDELGAIVRQEGPAGGWELTRLGRDLARLPVDPTVGRMLLQARTEKAVREVAVIAAALSIQDPRERPLDKQTQADAAHRKFTHPDSDFLTLLNLWESVHDEVERASQSRMRRFCRDHFLSYIRMREWRDIHDQLIEVLHGNSKDRPSSVWDAVKPDQRTDEKLQSGSRAYAAIHRSILSGLLSNIALRDEERGGFKATHDRKVGIFPGSALFQKEESRGGKNDPRKKTKAPRWLMAAEIMETSRLYARTCARMDPRWVLDLGEHLLKISHSEPFWNPDQARVLVKQRIRLHGLELETRAVGYGRINPVDATEIFIREGLVNDTVTWPFDFLQRNRETRAKLESLLTRTRDSGYLNLDEAIYRFYANHLSAANDALVSSVPELVDLVRHRKQTRSDYLEFSMDDLRGEKEIAHDVEAFPESLPLENCALPLDYHYRPGQDDDGVTLNVKVREAELLTSASLDWAVPGHLEQKVEHCLRTLPKELRRTFMPLAEKVKTVSAAVSQLSRLRGGRDSLVRLLAEHLHAVYGLRIDGSYWSDKPFPDHLKVRVRVEDDEGRELCASRDLAEVQSQLAERLREVSHQVTKDAPEAWLRARARWERGESETWNFGDLPDSVQVCEQAGVPVMAYPALVEGNFGVSLRLNRSEAEARQLNQKGLSRLLDSELRRDLAWLQKDLKSLRSLGPLVAVFCPMERLLEDAYDCLRNWLCDAGRVSSLTKNAFTEAAAEARQDLRGVVPRLMDSLREILELRQALTVHPQPYPGLTKDLDALVPSRFLGQTPYRQLAHFPRYLRALKARADRWKQNPAKDAERARTVEKYQQALGRMEEGEGRQTFRWLLEEFRVSLFAQELGTAEPVSAVKLDRLLESLGGAKSAVSSEAAKPARNPAPASKPLIMTSEKKAKPIKSLGGLDSLFRR